jgi:hypothetical protein
LKQYANLVGGNWQGTDIILVWHGMTVVKELAAIRIFAKTSSVDIRDFGSLIRPSSAV